MLTDKDIDKLMKVFPTKDQVERIVENKIAPLVEGQQQILIAVEGLAFRLDAQNLENSARDAQLTRHDGWIQQIAKQAKVKLVDA